LDCTSRATLDHNYHDVIQNADVDQAQCLFQAIGDQFVGLGRFGNSTWVRMRQNHSCGV
jgi:hypothetical protein